MPFCDSQHIGIAVPLSSIYKIFEESMISMWRYCEFGAMDTAAACRLQGHDAGQREAEPETCEPEIVDMAII
jgi:hypothetical protein